jgi:hypothetical protein
MLAVDAMARLTEAFAFTFNAHIQNIEIFLKMSGKDFFKE